MWTWTLWMFPLLSMFIMADLPAKPENISCILYYKKNLTCSWSTDKRNNDTKYILERTYFSGRRSERCTANNYKGGNRASCSFTGPTISPLEHTIQVNATNADGVTASDKISEKLDTIMKLEPPVILSVKPILGVKRMVQVTWKMAVTPYSPLVYMLQNRKVHSNHWMDVSFNRSAAARRTNQIDRHSVTGLQAFAEYSVRMQCKVIQSRLWSDWSQEEIGTTEEEAPYGLDVWRILGPAEANGNRKVQVLWKKAKGAPVLEKALSYTIQYSPGNTTLIKILNTTEQRCDLTLDSKAYLVSVVSYNSQGKSPEAQLKIPAVEDKALECITSVKTHLIQDQLVVEWESSKAEVNMWVLEWYKDVDSEPLALSWDYVSHTWNWTFEKDELEPFVCYNISVYPMSKYLAGKPYSTQVYVKEDVPSGDFETKVKNIGVKTATITWEEIPKKVRRGFIRNYTIFCQADNGKEFSKTVNSSILQYELKFLTRNTFYTVWVMANTSIGGANSSSINFKTLSTSIHEIIHISFLVGGGLLALITLVVAYGLKRPNILKHLCCPNIPNPANSSVAVWPGNDSKDKLNLKFSDPVDTGENKILKPCLAPSDLIDKLVVNYENFLEEVSVEEPRKGQEVVLGGEKNEYVTFPNGPPCQLEETIEEIPVLTESPPGTFPLCSGISECSYSESEEQLLSSAPSLSQDYFCEEYTPNLYLKNSVTTREFLTSEKLLDKTEKNGCQ